MKRFQFSLSALVVGIGVVAIGLGSLASSSETVHYWREAIIVLTTAMLLIAVVGALFRQAGKRAYWTGFGLFGWVYFLLFFLGDRLFGIESAARILAKILPSVTAAHVTIARCMQTMLLAVL